MSKPNKASALNGLHAIKPNAAKNLNALNTEMYSRVKSRREEKLVFSFKLFDKSHDAFNLGGVDSEWYVSLLEVMAEWSKYSWLELNQDYRSVYDPHIYNPDSANVKDVHKYLNLDQHDLYQLRISKSKGRVHGSIVGNRFYILWLDPRHNMYDCDGYPCYKSGQYIAPKTPFEVISDECEEVKRINGDLVKENEELYDLIDEDICSACDYSFKMKQ